MIATFPHPSGRLAISESSALKLLLKGADISFDTRQKITNHACCLIEQIRAQDSSSVMELFLGEYGLSSREGVALMCLAEALLRVPDGDTMDALIEDKIAPSQWGRHLGHSHSSLVNASTWALFLTGKVLQEPEENDDEWHLAGVLHSLIKRVGEPIIRQAVNRVMRELGSQFVLGETIQSATNRARINEGDGYSYSYDMLGEAALNQHDADQYFDAYGHAIKYLGSIAQSADTRENPGISIKLSALHPRYETLQKQRVMAELVPRLLSLAKLAKAANIGLNIDAEESGRLELSMEVIGAVFADKQLDDWDGFGVVVQAYNLRAPIILDQLYALAQTTNKKMMVRLVKGAYWDTEIKLAQVEGHDGFDVFTRKPSTDVSYICCAKKLLSMRDHFYPQFATHNAHSIAAILDLAGETQGFEFQRLHGMGEALHKLVLEQYRTKCRIYAPVGSHRDLLAYLVRRMLENGANSSFVNQLIDEKIAPKFIATDPFEVVERYLESPENPAILQPGDLFSPERANSKGWDITNPTIVAELENGLRAFDKTIWSGNQGSAQKVTNPANRESVGSVKFLSATEAASVCDSVNTWEDCSAPERAKILNRAADLYEENHLEIFSLLMREAGKTLVDCIGELREAVDFLRYYAQQSSQIDAAPAGIFSCISPWNFPLAIFTGQISAALATGNGVLAKPAESTSLIAEFAVSLLHRAGVPRQVLKLLLGAGREVGSVLSSHPNIDGVCFTGSLNTAQIINRSMAKNLSTSAPLIAETGGLNAMIVDSTALPEQAVRDIITSAFQSAGQRCSALRVLYLQEDIATDFLSMLFGAMDELKVGDPRNFSTDIGPVIDKLAREKIDNHIQLAESENRLLKQLKVPEGGNFVGPAVLKIEGIHSLDEEIFGPVLHVANYKANEFDMVIKAINQKNYGLTFGIHSRIDGRAQDAVDNINAGNIYVNRNQIGAIVQSQPFGGEGLSGTGPKAGGPRYLHRFIKTKKGTSTRQTTNPVEPILIEKIELAFASFPNTNHTPITSELMPGPTGESNQYSTSSRKRVLCLGPSAHEAEEQLKRARKLGCNAIGVAPECSSGIDGFVSADILTEIPDLEVVIYWGEDDREMRTALAKRPGPIAQFLNDLEFEKWLLIERHICIDTTAAGGNAALLSACE